MLEFFLLECVIHDKRLPKGGWLSRHPVDSSIAFTCWQAIPNHFPHVELDAFVIMPNHLHGILVINDILIRAQHCRALHIFLQNFFSKPLYLEIGNLRGFTGAIAQLLRVLKSKIPNLNSQMVGSSPTTLQNGRK